MSELLLFERKKWSEMDDMKGLFTRYGLSMECSDIFFYGVLKNTKEYPQFRELVRDHRGNLEIDNVLVINSGNGESRNLTNDIARLFSTEFLQLISILYDGAVKGTLFIDETGISNVDKSKVDELKAGITSGR